MVNFHMACLAFWAYVFQVKKLEELGIGRPSTYAVTLKVLKVAYSVKWVKSQPDVE